MVIFGTQRQLAKLQERELSLKLADRFSTEKWLYRQTGDPKIRWFIETAIFRFPGLPF